MIDDEPVNGELKTRNRVDDQVRRREFWRGASLLKCLSGKVVTLTFPRLDWNNQVAGGKKIWKLETS